LQWAPPRQAGASDRARKGTAGETEGMDGVGFGEAAGGDGCRDIDTRPRASPTVYRPVLT